MLTYATLHQLRRYLGLRDGQTADDALLSELLGAASRLIERFTGRRFYPVRGVRRYDCRQAFALLLNEDLLALHALTNGDGRAIDLADVHLQPPGGPPYGGLFLDKTRVAFVYDDDPLEALAVDGTWGYHPDWANAWRDSGAALADDPLDAAAETLHLSGSGALFEPGQLARIGDETLTVEACDAVAGTLTVTRGAHGTAPAMHPVGTALAIYAPPQDVVQVCLRVAAWLYRQKDAGWVQTAGGLRGQVVVPPALPDDVALVLGPYVRLRVA